MPSEVTGDFRCRSRVLERSAIALEHFVTAVNSSVPDCYGTAEVAVPWSRQPVRFTKAEVPWLIRETRTVLLAQARHAQVAPPWAIPLPVGDEISPLLSSTSGPMCLLGNFACSVMMMGYDYLGHPSFYDFGCGVMAHPRAPDRVRNDVESETEFPAKELPGLCGRMVWFGEGLPAQVRVELLGR